MQTKLIPAFCSTKKKSAALGQSFRHLFIRQILFYDIFLTKFFLIQCPTNAWNTNEHPEQQAIKTQMNVLWNPARTCPEFLLRYCLYIFGILRCQVTH